VRSTIPCTTGEDLFGHLAGRSGMPRAVISIEASCCTLPFEYHGSTTFLTALQCAVLSITT